MDDLLGGWIGAKAIRKDAVKMEEANGNNLKRYHQGKRRNANRGVERGLRGAKGNVYEENIISAGST